jgi:polar amino acid transport system substrate-binding protein
VTLRAAAVLLAGLLPAAAFGQTTPATAPPAPAGALTAEVDLGPEFAAMPGYVMTQTLSTVPPGTGRAPHSHADFPEVVRILSGTLTEFRDGEPPRPHGPGETLVNAGGIRHGWVNLGSDPVVYLATAIRKAAAVPAAQASVLEAARDLAPSGRLKVAINLGNAVLAARDPKTAALSGVSVTLAKAMGEALGVPVDLMPYVSAGETFDGGSRGEWALAFMAIDPQRAEKLRFSTPYVVIEGTYLVRQGSAFRAIADLDRPGVKIAVARGSAYDLFLSRQLKNATLLRTVTTNDAIALFEKDHLDAVAAIRQALLPTAAAGDDYAVLPGRFMRIEQAIAVPVGHGPGTAFADRFIRNALASGQVKAALEANGQEPGLLAPIPAPPPPPGQGSSK